MAKRMKKTCQGNTEFCRRVASVTVCGTYKGDKSFRVCLACLAIYRRAGIKLKQVSA